VKCREKPTPTPNAEGKDEGHCLPITVLWCGAEGAAGVGGVCCGAGGNGIGVELEEEGVELGGDGGTDDLRPGGVVEWVGVFCPCVQCWWVRGIQEEEEPLGGSVHGVLGLLGVLEDEEPVVEL
jgi:hypothetical protein